MDSRLRMLQPAARADAPGALRHQRQGGRGQTGAAQRLQRCSSTVRGACVSRPGGGGEDGEVQAGCGRRAGTGGQAAGGPWGGRRSLWRDVASG
jgi:hypothetical protein